MATGPSQSLVTPTLSWTPSMSLLVMYLRVDLRALGELWRQNNEVGINKQQPCWWAGQEITKIRTKYYVFRVKSICTRNVKKILTYPKTNLKFKYKPVTILIIFVSKIGLLWFKRGLMKVLCLNLRKKVKKIYFSWSLRDWKLRDILYPEYYCHSIKCFYKFFIVSA